MTRERARQVKLSPADVRWAQELATKTQGLFAGRTGHYQNTWNSHFRGKLGEIACARWLENNSVSIERLFEHLGRTQQADIQLSPPWDKFIEIKTWDDSYWNDLGRCVPIAQIPELSTKADLVLWCTSPSKLNGEVTVTIAGWNSVKEIIASPKRFTGPKGGRQVFNHQVDLQRVRSPKSLLCELVDLG
jgi:hypothetical protein